MRSSLITRREHLLRDLEPFTCLFPRGIQTNRPKTECSTFETIEAWINHMQDYHVYHLWECRCTSHGLKIYKSEAEFQEHVHWDHRVLRKAPERYISPHRISKLREIVRCPFGDGFSVTGDGDPSRPFPNEAFHRHVAVHMMEIALLILESFPRDDEDDCNIAR